VQEFNFYRDCDIGDWVLDGYPHVRLCGQGVEEIFEVEDDAYKLTLLVYGEDDPSDLFDAIRCYLRPSKTYPSVFIEIDKDDDLFREISLTSSAFCFFEDLGLEFYVDAYFWTGEPEPWEGVDRDY
jgi:hypothetical protein